MLALLLTFLGRVLALLPESAVRGLCVCLGWCAYRLTSRGRISLSNLHHAFPEAPPNWQQRVALESCHRMFELFFFALSAPFFSEERMRRSIQLAEGSAGQRVMDLLRGESTLFLVPHTTLMEALVWMPQIVSDCKPIGVFFRNLDIPSVDAWIKQQRERAGLHLLSRRADALKAKQYLSSGKHLGFLFDQNAGDAGSLILFFKRVASATDFPGSLALRTRARTAILLAERTGFWRAVVQVEELPAAREPVDVAIEAHRWLEGYLERSPDTCADWLWAHARWKTQMAPRTLLQLRAKRNHLERAVEQARLPRLPRRTRLWVRLPNWLGDVIMALPLIEAIARGRPDAEVTLLGQPHFEPLIERYLPGCAFVALPAKGEGYFAFFRDLSYRYPDIVLLFTNSLRGDREASLTRAPRRLGILRAGKRRPLLSHTWQVPEGLDESRLHQTRFWEQYLQHFGLQEGLNLTPLERHEPPVGDAVIGLIPGTENAPQKRWPLEHWQTFVRQLADARPEARFYLFGTSRDADLTREVARGFRRGKVTDLAGKTTLGELPDHFRKCHLIVSNDTGGMHLANAAGVPVVAVYGPTNPVRTGLVFQAPATIIQPPGCPPVGGRDINLVTPGRVTEACLKLLPPPTRNPSA